MIHVIVHLVTGRVLDLDVDPQTSMADFIALVKTIDASPITSLEFDRGN